MTTATDIEIRAAEEFLGQAVSDPRRGERPAHPSRVVGTNRKFWVVL